MEPKPGLNTTELWLIVAFMVMVLANGTDYINVPWDTVTWLGGLVGVYTGGRSFVKAKTVTVPAPAAPPAQGAS